MNDLKDYFKSKLKEVDETCEIHGTKLVSGFGRPAICMECAKEDKEKREQELVEKVSADYFKRNTYNWLGQHSIFLDETLK